MAIKLTRYKGTTKKFKKHDIGVVLASTDLASYAAMVGPTSGNQEITGPTMGSSKFQALADMLPKIEDVSLLIKAFNETRDQMPGPEEFKPAIHPIMQADTDKEHFEDASAQVRPWSILGNVAEKKFLKPALLTLFKDKTAGLVHGMVQYCERLANFMSDERGIKSPWNRALRDVPVNFFSDYVNPQDSRGMSNEAVEKAVKEGEPFISKLLTNFFLNYAERIPPSAT